MQISGLSSSSELPSFPNKRVSAPKSAQDEAVLQTSAESFSSLVKQAGQFPEVRADVVNSFKARVQSGEYPTPEAVSGLVDVIGGYVLQQATTAPGS